MRLEHRIGPIEADREPLTDQQTGRLMIRCSCGWRVRGRHRSLPAMSRRGWAHVADPDADRPALGFVAIIDLD
jgi:hypothetical protein